MCCKLKIPPYSWLLAQVDSQGKITNLVTSNAVINKLAWYETNTFHWLLMLSSILVFLSGLVVSILALINFPGNSSHQLAQAFSGIICGLNLIAAGGMLILNPLTKKNYRLQWQYGLPKIVPVSLSIFLLTSVLALGLPVLAILAWMSPEWSLSEQLHYSVVSLFALGLIPFLNYWNLLGFRY